MRLLRCLAILTAVVQHVSAITSAVNTTAPECGLKCILTSVGTSDCSLANTTCICTNVPLNDAVTACVTANCTIRDQLQTKKFSTETCGIRGENRTALVRIVGVTFGALGLAAFGLRCLARLYVGSQAWGVDDWIMCVAVCAMIPLNVISIPLSNNGLGLDMWNVPFDDITSILYLYYWDEMLYVTALSLTKVSILFFYLKVFPRRLFRYFAYGLIALNLCFVVTLDLVLAFQCRPISSAWLSWDGTFPSRCLSINLIGWSAAAINIALDLAVIILPLPELFGLSMSWRKKGQILLMFAVGLFVTFVSIIRLRSLIEFGNTKNVTQDYVAVGYWSTIEVPVGIICACMPAIRSLFSLVFPKVFGTSRNASGYGLGGSMAAPSSTARGLSSHPGAIGSTLGGGNIKVKQEWQVISETPVGGGGGHHGDDDGERYVSSSELVPFEAMEEENNGTAATRKMRLARQPGGEWAGRPFEVDETSGFEGVEWRPQGKKHTARS